MSLDFSPGFKKIYWEIREGERFLTIRTYGNDVGETLIGIFARDEMNACVGLVWGGNFGAGEAEKGKRRKTEGRRKVENEG